MSFAISLVKARMWFSKRPRCRLAAALLLPALAVPCYASDQTPTVKAADKPIDYLIVVTGSELLNGTLADGHTSFITRTLFPLGLHCVGSLCVDDNAQDIESALRFASARAPFIIVTGGLGPTDNDVTRQTLAHFTGTGLREHPEVLAQMEKRFRTPRDQIRENLLRQTRVPLQGDYLKNSNGTAVGLIFDDGRRVVVALPGPPRELQPMVVEELVPYLNRRFGTRLPGCSRTIRFVGLGQSQIDQTLKEHVPLPRDVILMSQFEGGRVDFTFTFPDDTPENRQRLQTLRNNILEYLKDNVYADDGKSLEQVVISLLRQRKETLTLGEVATGGSLAASLTLSDETPPVLTGSYSAPTEERLRQLLGIPDGDWQEDLSATDRAVLLANGIARHDATDWSIVIGQTRAEGDSSQVTVAVRRPGGQLDTLQTGYRNDSSSRARLITQLLDVLRRKLL